MLDILFNPAKAERHPLEMMLIGFFYSSISIFLGFWIFPEHASLVMVFLTTLSCLYVVQGAIKIEESKESNVKSEKWILKEHYKALSFLIFLFLGFILSFIFWTFVLPHEKIQALFSLQDSVVENIRSISSTGKAISSEPFALILLNNLKVLFISLVFSFFYGAGAIFILAWNASIMGFVIGTLARRTFGFIALPLAFTKYFLHGFFEMTAYLLAALAGGIIYISICKKDLFDSNKTKRIVIDASILTGIAVLLLILAALIEVYISPLL